MLMPRDLPYCSTCDATLTDVDAHVVFNPGHHVLVEIDPDGTRHFVYGRLRSTLVPVPHRYSSIPRETWEREG